MIAKKCCLGLALLVLPATMLAQAPDAFGPGVGDWELTLGGGGSNNRDFDSGSFGINGSLGYYLTEALEIGVRQSVSYSEFGSPIWNGSTRGALDYHFNLKRLRPFIGINAGGIYGRTVNDSWAAGLETGFKFYVREKTFIFASGEYQWLFKDVDRADNNFDKGLFLYSLGIGFHF